MPCKISLVLALIDSHKAEADTVVDSWLSEVIQATKSLIEVLFHNYPNKLEESTFDASNPPNKEEDKN